MIPVNSDKKKHQTIDQQKFPLFPSTKKKKTASCALLGLAKHCINTTIILPEHLNLLSASSSYVV